MRLLASVVLIVVLFEGLRILLLSSYQAKSIGLVMLFAGYFMLRRNIRPSAGKQKISLLPYAGVLVIFGDAFYNIVIKNSTEFLGLDWMTIFLGGALIVYNLIPEKYETEARFLVIFLGLFFISISLPLALLFLDVGSKAGAYYMRSFISDPLAGLLNLVGIRASTAYNWVYYRGKTDTIQLGMGISCSGAYSFAIFFSAFMAYVHIQYGKLNRKLLLLLTAGLAGTYLANLLRVFLIALIGFYYGTDALILAHRNFGWIIFMVWVTLFWYIGFKVFLEGKRLKVAFSSDEGDTQ